MSETAPSGNVGAWEFLDKGAGVEGVVIGAV